MAKFRQVYTTFWNDPKVTEEMTPEDRYFYLYLITNPNTTQIGVYSITKKQMAFDLGYSIESINSLMDRFETHHELIVYNNETRELAIKNWAKYNL
ncbi:DNA replication protein DnaD, partial [Bacillus altitudinis]